MSLFENNQYRWRETYFVLFHSGDRPSLEKVKEALSHLKEHYTLSQCSADEDSLFESLTLFSPDDFAAMDICYIDGEEVLEQCAELVDQLEPAACKADDMVISKRIRQCDARLDILHFEQIPEEEEFEESDEMLDPSALLLVLDALTSVTDGIAVDPQSGTVIGEDE